MSNAPKFTPGPWFATPGPWFATPGWPSGRALGVHSKADGGVVEFHGLAKPGSKEGQANARLIVAAPELYAALNEMVEAYWIGSEDDAADPPACIKRALAALARAVSP